MTSVSLLLVLSLTVVFCSLYSVVNGFQLTSCSGVETKVYYLNMTQALLSAKTIQLKIDAKGIVEQFVSKRNSNSLLLTVLYGVRKGQTANIKFRSTVEQNSQYLTTLSGIEKDVYGGGQFGGCEPHFRVKIDVPEQIAKALAEKKFSVVTTDFGSVQARKKDVNPLSGECQIRDTTCPSCCSGNGACTSAGCICRAGYAGPACDLKLDLSLYKSALAFEHARWSPMEPYDTCSQEIHEQYFVIGPDEKKYNTWHPPVHYFADGTNCTFGHEHGLNPALSRLWPAVVEHFSATPELAPNAGLPFGYANEQLEEYRQFTTGPKYSRHEDHVGHKIIWEHKLLVDVAINHTARADTGFRFDALAKFHQGSHSPDAFTNNLHELQYFAKSYNLKRPSYRAQDFRVTTMASFGKPGEMLRMPCNLKNDFAPLKTGWENTDPNYPAFGEGSRMIPYRDCAEQRWLVSEGYSGHFYENWGTTVYLIDGSKTLLYVPIGFAVFNPSRYFDPRKPNNMSLTYELCFEELQSEGKVKRAHGGECDYLKQVTRNTKPPANSPKALFVGNHRETYFKVAIIDNTKNTPYFFSDPFGRSVVTRGQSEKANKRGGIIQYVNTTPEGPIDYGDEYINPQGKREKKSLEPFVSGTHNDNGGLAEGVHMPN